MKVDIYNIISGTILFLNGYFLALIMEDINDRNLKPIFKIILVLLFSIFGCLFLVGGFLYSLIKDLLIWINYHTSIKFFWQFYLTKKWLSLTEEELNGFKDNYKYLLSEQVKANKKLSFRERNLFRGYELIRKRYNKPVDWYTKEDSYESKS